MNKYSLGKQKTLAELCVDKDDKLHHLQAKYAAVVAELGCAKNDIELRDREIAALKDMISDLKGEVADLEIEKQIAADSLPKLKAEAIREAATMALYDANKHGEAFDCGYLLECADKIEAGK